MKTQTQTLFNKAGNTAGKSLATGAEESLEKGSVNNQSKTFRSVDMWNIHRQRRSLVIR